MKKILLSVTATTFILGSLVGCGAADQQTQTLDNAPNTFQSKQQTHGLNTRTGVTDFGGNDNGNSVAEPRTQNFRGLNTDTNTAPGNKGQGRQIRENREHKGHFPDVAEGAWFAKDAEILSEAGIMNGYDGNFNPNKPLKRGEVATLIVNLIEQGYLVIPENAPTDTTTGGETTTGDTTTGGGTTTGDTTTTPTDGTTTQ